MVEKGVARFALDLLREKGVSVVLNVKASVMERLSRCLGTRIVASVESLQANSIGFCREFRVEAGGGAGPTIVPHDPLPVGLGTEGDSHREGPSALPLNHGSSQPLMFFEGCPKPAGVAILLRGGDLATLTKVKKGLD